MNLVWWSFFLPWAIYVLGMITAKPLTRRLPALAAWVKKLKTKNIGAGLQIIALPYPRRALYIGIGNLMFGLSLTVSGLLLGLPPLILLFRNSLMTWGILGGGDVISITRHKYFRFLAVAETVAFLLWASLGVQVGLSVLALLASRSDILMQQKPLLAALPWLLLVMLTVLVLCALLEAHMIGTYRHKLIQSFFQRPAGAADGQEGPHTEKRLVS